MQRKEQLTTAEGKYHHLIGFMFEGPIRRSSKTNFTCCSISLIFLNTNSIKLTFTTKFLLLSSLFLLQLYNMGLRHHQLIRSWYKHYSQEDTPVFIPYFSADLLKPSQKSKKSSMRQSRVHSRPKSKERTSKEINITSQMINLNQSQALQSAILQQDSKSFDFPSVDQRMTENIFGLTMGKVWKLLKDVKLISPRMSLA